MTKVLLYCTQPILEVGLRRIVEDLPDFQLIDCCGNAESLREQAKTQHPELIMVEMTFAITLDFLRELIGVKGSAHVVLWINDASDEFLAQAIELGVRGILGKDQSVAEYGRFLRSVAAGEIRLDQDLAGRLLSRKQVRLTPRERQLIGLLTQGLSNKEIAYSLGIGEGTVKVYLSKLFMKVGAGDRFELALMGLRNVEADSRNAFDRVTAKPANRPVPFAIPAFLSTDRAPATI